MKHVDIGIPANNKGKHSIGCLFWMLARMVLQMRGTILPGHKWDIMVDLFFYREPEEAKDHEDEEAPVAEYTADYTAPALALPGDQWGADIPDAQWGVPESSAAVVAVPDWPGAAVPIAAEGWDTAPAPLPTAAGWDAASTPSIPTAPVPGWEPSAQPSWAPEAQ